MIFVLFRTRVFHGFERLQTLLSTVLRNAEWDGTLVVRLLAGGIHQTLYRKRSNPVGLCGVPDRRLEDRIREFCAKAVASDEAEFRSVMSELRSAMRQHVDRIRTLAVRQLAGERPRGDENRE
jgi:hypothetical protein